MPIKHLAWGFNGRHMRRLSGGVVIAPYQQWTDLPQSPLLTSNYPYQFIYVDGSIVQVVMCVNKWYVDGVYVRTSGEYKYSALSAGAWGTIQTYNGIFGSQYKVTQCNHDIYANSSLTTVWKAKTTA